MTSAPFTTRTEIEAEIARLTRQRNEWNILGWSDWDQDADIKAQIADLEDEVRFVECQHCEGAGEIATGTDWIGGVPDTRIERCPDCDGTGRAETPVERVECDDDLTEIETATEREAA